ncbi:MAG: hypothetical protein HS115_06005 [Spirochaetales bacterium]|nr:hypothetical protein [Spirochaetales bacterium]
MIQLWPRKSSGQVKREPVNWKRTGAIAPEDGRTITPDRRAIVPAQTGHFDGGAPQSENDIAQLQSEHQLLLLAKNQNRDHGKAWRPASESCFTFEDFQQGGRARIKGKRNDPPKIKALWPALPLKTQNSVSDFPCLHQKS